MSKSFSGCWIPRTRRGKVADHKVINAFAMILIFVIFLSDSIAANAKGGGVKINSDDLRIDKANSSASFKGSVRVMFDDIILQTDYLKAYYINDKASQKRSIQRIEIPGKVTVMRIDCREIVSADSAEYRVSSHELILQGNVRARKNDNLLITDKMIYITKFQMIEDKKD